MCINKQGIESDITSIQLSLIFNCGKADFHHWLSTAARELITKPSCPRKISLSRSAFLLWFHTQPWHCPSLRILSSEKKGIWKIFLKVELLLLPTHTRGQSDLCPSPVSGVRQKLHFRQQNQHLQLAKQDGIRPRETPQIYQDSHLNISSLCAVSNDTEAYIS